MPERYEAYNLLQRLGPENVFDRAFLDIVDVGAPMRRMRDVYENLDAKSLINRMLGVDFQFTLTDNDLPKVTRMSELAGVDAQYGATLTMKDTCPGRPTEPTLTAMATNMAPSHCNGVGSTP